MCLCVAACSAPQGKKIGMNGGTGTALPDVATGPTGPATGPTLKVSTIGWKDRQSTVEIGLGKTLTVALPSYGREEFAWRFSEIPDPTVLKMVSKEFTPSAEPHKAGEQTMVFEGTGPGEVELKMWYGSLWATPMDSTRMYTVAISVVPEPVQPSPSKKGKTKKHVVKT